MDGVNQERGLIHVLLGMKNYRPDRFEKIDSYFLHSASIINVKKDICSFCTYKYAKPLFADDVDSNQLNLN